MSPTTQLTKLMMVMIARMVMMMMIGCNGFPAFGFAKGEAAAGSNSNIGNFHTPSTFGLLGNSYISASIAFFFLSQFSKFSTFGV